MKRSLLILAGAGSCVGLVICANLRKGPALSPEETAVEAMPSSQAPSKTFAVEGVRPGQNSPSQPGLTDGPLLSTDAGLALSEAIEAILSPQSKFEQKQAIWKRLLEKGELDQAIAEVEQRAASDPNAGEYPAFLGQAYLKKCGLTKDVREQAQLGMKADQALETALNLDPSNMEARFMKAVGMSYWPPQLNKGNEVIEQFQTLIQQQEALPPEPQFARSYAWLGEQYRKSGANEYAAQVWQRGAALFPNNEELKRKLTAGR